MVESTKSLTKAPSALVRILTVCFLWAVFGYAIQAIYAAKGGHFAINEMGVVQAGLLTPLVLAINGFMCVGPSLGLSCAGTLFLLGFPASVVALLFSKSITRFTKAAIAVTVFGGVGLICVVCVLENSGSCKPSLSFFM
jgi:hypothetical protein